MMTTFIDPGGGIAAAHSPLIPAEHRGTAVPPQRARIVLRRLDVTAADKARPEGHHHQTRKRATHGMEKVLSGACDRTHDMLRGTHAHQDGISAGNADGGRSDALALLHEGEVRSIERAMPMCRAVLRRSDALLNEDRLGKAVARIPPMMAAIIQMPTAIPRVLLATKRAHQSPRSSGTLRGER